MHGRGGRIWGSWRRDCANGRTQDGGYQEGHAHATQGRRLLGCGSRYMLSAGHTPCHSQAEVLSRSYGMLFADDAPDIYLDEWLQRQLCVSEDGEYTVREADLSHSTYGPKWNFSHKVRESRITCMHQEGLNVFEGLEIYVFDWSRAHFLKMVLSLGKMFSEMKFTNYRGNRGDWVSRLRTSWTAHSERAGLGARIVRGNAGLTLEQALRSTACALSECSVSLAGYRYLLARWSGPEGCKSRLVERAGRQRSKGLLHGFCRSVCANDSFKLRIEYVTSWTPHWPRPS